MYAIPSIYKSCHCADAEPISYASSVSGTILPVNVVPAEVLVVKYDLRSVSENNLVVPASVPSNFSDPDILESVAYVCILAILFFIIYYPAETFKVPLSLYN